MKIRFFRDLEKKLKGWVNRFRIHQTDFTIISNNCWGTFIYKKFAISYNSPFVNLFIFAPDYIKLLESFSIEKLKNLTFISHESSRYKKELQEEGIYNHPYPIGKIDDDIEIHFLHYKSEEDARKKWERRIERINPHKLIIKFSDGDNATDELIKRFDKLPFDHKLCFTAKPFPEYSSVIYLQEFKGKKRVRDEWKFYHKYVNIYQFINKL